MNTTDIKFKAFIKRYKAIAEVHSINFATNEIVTYETFGIKERSIQNVFKQNEYELLQYTGMTDANGTEIYRGDYNEDYDVVIWCEQSNGWQWAIYDFPTKDKIQCHCYHCAGDFNFLDEIKSQVIEGNIFLNPELLEKNNG